ncbi:MAG: DUF541 domain-containing protein [Legionellales bacterium]|nr:DUF541 domain-containing protein [Legionellales bacterium]
MAKYLTAALLLAIGIALSGFFISQGFVLGKAADRTVTVKGLAERVVKADEGIWRIYFTYASDELTELYQGVATSQQAIRDFLLKGGFAATEITDQPVSVNDNQGNYYSSNENAKRFSAEGGVTVRTENVDQVNAAVQQTGQLVQQGVLIRQSDVLFNFTQLNDIKPDMLNEATANATEAATTFAQNSQSQLGQILTANQGLFTISDATSGATHGADMMKKVRVVTTVQYYLQ